MAVTMKDVAHRAGVSIRTVSRAINDLEDVSTETRDRILSVAAEMGFRPSQLARALVTRRSHILGLVIPHITNPYFAEVAQGVFTTAREKGYSVLLNHCDWSKLPDINGWYTLADHAAEGLITDLLYGHEADIYRFSSKFKPIVVLMKTVTGPGVSTVKVDIENGAKKVLHYLICKGHREIGMIAPTVDHPEAVERISAYKQTMEEISQTPRIGYIPAGMDPDVQSGAAAARKLLQDYPDLSAVFCYNDLIAIGTLNICGKLGISVPDQLAVTGFDDISFAAITHPALTTVRVDQYELGRQAVIRLLEMIEQPERVFAPVQLDVELIVRESA